MTVAAKQAPMQTDPHIRWMIRRDMPEVLAIEDACFEILGWSEEEFIAVLRKRNMVGMVAEVSDRVVGFMLYELHRNKLTLLNFAVMPEKQRWGVGTAMVRKLKNKLSEQRRNRIELAIADFNLPGQLFFRAMGFKATKILAAHSEDAAGNDVDCYHMEYRYEGAD